MTADKIKLYQLEVKAMLTVKKKMLIVKSCLSCQKDDTFRNHLLNRKLFSQSALD